MMEKKRIAICGCKVHVDKFIDLINSFEESEVCALYDTKVGRGKEVAKRHALPYCDNFDEMLETYHPDAVAILSENYEKAGMMLKAAKEASPSLWKNRCASLMKMRWQYRKLSMTIMSLSL